MTDVAGWCGVALGWGCAEGDTIHHCTLVWLSRNGIKIDLKCVW